MDQPRVRAWVTVLGGDRYPCIDTYEEVSECAADAGDNELVELFLLSRYDTAMRIKVRAAAIISITEDAEKPIGYATGGAE